MKEFTPVGDWQATMECLLTETEKRRGLHPRNGCDAVAIGSGNHRFKGTQTEQNLLKSFADESLARNRYTYFASKARKDGFEQIAAFFDETAAQEKEHTKLFFKFLEGKRREERYRKLLQNVENDEVFKRTGKMVWACRNCGFLYYGEQSPDVCPCCDHPKAFFELAADNY